MAQKDKQGLPNRYNPANDDTLVVEDSNVVVSSTECTGLTPSAVLNRAESESYSNIYPVPLPINQVDNGLQREKGIGPDMDKKKGK